MKDIKYRHEWYRDVIKVVRTAVWHRDGTGWGIKNYFSGDWGFKTGGDHDIKETIIKTRRDMDEKPIDIKWRREMDFGFRTKEWLRTGPSIFAQQDWFRITKTGGIIKTGSRTSEDFRQEDWFRVSGDWGTKSSTEYGGVRWGGGEGAKTGGWDARDSDGDFYREGWRDIFGGDGEGGYVPWNRLAHSGDWGL